MIQKILRKLHAGGLTSVDTRSECNACAGFGRTWGCTCATLRTKDSRSMDGDSLLPPAAVWQHRSSRMMISRHIHVHEP
eukprot:4043114-Karenia_brevis.AAC.1